MGTAFAYPCIDRDHDVRIVGTHLENEFIDKLNNNKFHASLKLKISEKIKFLKYSYLSGEFKKKNDLIVIGVNSRGIEWVSDKLKDISKSNSLPPILMLTTGLSIYDNRYELLVDKIERLLTKKGFTDLNISAVGGPCLASGLANRVHSSVIFSNKNLETVKWLREILSTEYYHISITADVIGVEMCAAIKNFYSMIIGSAKSLNTAANLMQKSIIEMANFTKTLGGKEETAYGLAGLGDLYVSSAGGRNSKMGKYLGDGYVYSKAKSKFMPNETVEGAELAFEIGPKILKDINKKDFPLMYSLVDSLCNDKKLEIKW